MNMTCMLDEWSLNGGVKKKQKVESIWKYKYGEICVWVRKIYVKYVCGRNE